MSPDGDWAGTITGGAGSLQLRTGRSFKMAPAEPPRMSTDPRRLTLLALLALLPVAAFLLGRSTIAVLSAACVVLIAASLWRMFGPAQAAGH